MKERRRSKPRKGKEVGQGKGKEMEEMAERKREGKAVRDEGKGDRRNRRGEST